MLYPPRRLQFFPFFLPSLFFSLFFLKDKEGIICFYYYIPRRNFLPFPFTPLLSSFVLSLFFSLRIREIVVSLLFHSHRNFLLLSFLLYLFFFSSLPFFFFLKDKRKLRIGINFPLFYLLYIRRGFQLFPLSFLSKR